MRQENILLRQAKLNASLANLTGQDPVAQQKDHKKSCCGGGGGEKSCCGGHKENVQGAPKGCACCKTKKQTMMPGYDYIGDIFDSTTVGPGDNQGIRRLVIKDKKRSVRTKRNSDIEEEKAIEEFSQWYDENNNGN